MATSIVPALLDAVLAAATTALPDTLVLDGVGITEDPGDYLMVGVRDPSDGSSEAATSKEEQMAFGSTRPRKEEGELFLTAFSWNGDGNQKVARDAVYAIAGALATALRPNTLAVTGLLNIGYGADLTFRQGQSDYGAGAELMFSLVFEAAI